MADTIPIERPRRYFSLHFLLLRFLGLGWWHHPDENDTRNFPSWYLFYAIVTQLVWVVGFVGLETIYPFVQEKDLDRFMFSLSFVITHDLTLIKLYLFYFRNVEIQEIVRILEIDLYQFYQNNVMNHTTIKTSRIFTSAFLFFGWMTIGNSNIYAIIQDLRWKSFMRNLNDTKIVPVRNLPQQIYIPWSYQKDVVYIPTFALETIGLLWTGHIVMTIDTFVGSVILHMSTQFAILREALITAYDRSMESLRQNIIQNVESGSWLTVTCPSEEETDRIVRSFFDKTDIDKALERTLISCFLQHQILINCVEKFAITYSYGFMTQLLSSMAAICVIMVQVSQDASSFKSVKLVISLAFFFAMITQLAIQCFTGNELTYQASLISEGVMQCKWEQMSPRLRGLLLIMMMRAQRPLRLTAAGFAYMDNNCFFSIMKAAYSYYAVLSQREV